MMKNFSYFKYRQRGFTLVEMIVVMVITGIIGGMVAMFIRAPVEGYVDSARRADMTDIAETALRRITRDLRLALPNSVRVTTVVCGAATCSYLEFLPTGSTGCAANTVCMGGGRYRAGPGGGAACAATAGAEGEVLDFSAADGCFGVLGVVPPLEAGDQVVVYNLGIGVADAYTGTNRSAWAGTAGNIVTITPILFPFDSPGNRFHVVSTPVTYVCSPAVGGVGGTLRRYWGYAIQDLQTKTDSVAELDALVNPPNATRGSALLATNVSACGFTYDPLVSARNGLVTINLGITENGETVTLYNAAHVSNTP